MNWLMRLFPIRWMMRSIESRCEHCFMLVIHKQTNFFYVSGDHDTIQDTLQEVNDQLDREVENA